MPADLPEEILLQILEALREDRSTLFSAANVSARFRTAAHQILFSDLVLQPPKLSGAVYAPGERLAKLFETSPRIASCVRGITIVDDPSDAYDGVSWLSRDTALARALNALPLNHIQRFTFRRGYRTQWLQLTKPIKQAIMNICRSPSLTSLSLFWAPLRLVDLCGPSLRHLNLREVDANTDVECDAPRTTPIRLETLRLAHDFNLPTLIDFLLDTKTNKIDITGITKLYVLANQIWDHEEMPRLLEACSPTLEVLAFEPSSTAKGKEGSKQGTFSIADLPRLRKLAVRVQAANYEEDGYLDPLPWVIDLINTLPPTSILNTLHLQVSFDLEKIDNGGVGSTSWSRLDRTLPNRQLLPNLKCVELDLFSFVNSKLPSITAKLVRLIPNLRSTGILEMREVQGGYMTFEPFTRLILPTDRILRYSLLLH
ncbi:hypothetical protein BKA70DRAFT_1221661 [Coprinopsis sp. MPI-PUGE-AT-0042]|nr:hypothetical protein BKA70DRAFT_1221661 [Coprinopsis sp. MPI-PUGE-AT-0042]